MKAGLVMAFHAVAALADRDGVTLLVTGDEELGSPSSRALIEDEARGCAAALVLEASADGGALKIERKGVSLYDVARHRPGRARRARARARRQRHRRAGPPGAGGRRARPTRTPGTTVTPTASRAGTTTNTVPADGVVRGRRPGAHRRRAGPGRRRDARAAPGAARRRARGHRRAEPAAAGGRGVGGAVRRGPARSPRDSACRRSTAAAVGGASDGNFTAGVGTPDPRRLGAVGGGAHADDEHVLVDELPGRTALLAALVADLLARSDEPPRDDGARDHDEPGEARQHGRVTDLTTARRRDLDRAVQAADAAALAAGVSVREVADLAELDGRRRPATRRSGAATANPPVTLELLRAFTKAGNYVGGAFDGDRAGRRLRRLLRTRRPRTRCTATSPASRAAARAAASASRSSCTSGPGRCCAGSSEIAWTFDPLVSRNAYFNLVKLGRRAGRVPAELLRRRCSTRINGGDDSDRLLVRWRLRDPAVVAACAGGRARPSVADELAAGAVVALGVARRRRPGRRAPRRRRPSLVAVPPDIEALRAADPALAQRWRVAVREVAGGAARRRRADHGLRPRRLVRRPRRERR